MENCIFCKISRKEMLSDVVYEDDEVIAFHDIKPLVPVHILIIPKRHIGSVSEIEEGDSSLMGRLVFSASKIARELGISEGGYKLLFRVGKNGGQEIEHIHLHLLGGVKMREGIEAE